MQAALHGAIEFSFIGDNVIFSLAQTDISHAVRLYSVWPINFQYHSQAAAPGK